MARSDGRTSLELEERLAQVRARIPANEADLAEHEPLVQPRYDAWMEKRAFVEEVGAAILATKRAYEHAGAELERHTFDGSKPPREMITAVETLRRDHAVARSAISLARDEEHQAQLSYNRANLAAHEARQNLVRLRAHEESAVAELAKVQRQTVKAEVATTAALGFLDRVRQRVVGAA